MSRTGQPRGGPTLEELWNSAQRSGESFRRRDVAELPAPARRYLQHAIAEGAPIASAVRLRMHGEIKLRGWLPFRAEEVICRGRGLIWRATVRIGGLPVRGSDRLVDGIGAQRWALFGLIPVVRSEGSDVARSAADRMRAESIWLPSMLSGEGVEWAGLGEGHARARLAAGGRVGDVELAVDEAGRVETLRLERWGDPDGTGYRLERFGGLVEAEGTFGGYTIPTRLRIGWHFGTERFKEEGEFFRGRIESAEYR